MVAVCFLLSFPHSLNSFYKYYEEGASLVNDAVWL